MCLNRNAQTKRPRTYNVTQDMSRVRDVPTVFWRDATKYR